MAGETIAVSLLLLGDGFLLAVAVVDDRFKLALLPLLAAGCLWAVQRFPFAATCAVIELSATIFTRPFRRCPSAPWTCGRRKSSSGALLLVAFPRPLRDWWGGAAGVALGLIFDARTRRLARWPCPRPLSNISPTSYESL